MWRQPSCPRSPRTCLCTCTGWGLGTLVWATPDTAPACTGLPTQNYNAGQREGLGYADGQGLCPTTGLTEGAGRS